MMHTPRQSLSDGRITLLIGFLSVVAGAIHIIQEGNKDFNRKMYPPIFSNPLKAILSDESDARLALNQAKNFLETHRGEIRSVILNFAHTRSTPQPETYFEYTETLKLELTTYLKTLLVKENQKHITYILDHLLCVYLGDLGVDITLDSFYKRQSKDPDHSQTLPDLFCETLNLKNEWKKP